MIVCNQCGFQNMDDDSFCGSCGGFLEWTGEKVGPPPAAVVPEQAAGAQAQPAEPRADGARTRRARAR